MASIVTSLRSDGNEYTRVTADPRECFATREEAEAFLARFLKLFPHKGKLKVARLDIPATEAQTVWTLGENQWYFHRNASVHIGTSFATDGKAGNAAVAAAASALKTALGILAAVPESAREPIILALPDGVREEVRKTYPAPVIAPAAPVTPATVAEPVEPGKKRGE